MTSPPRHLGIDFGTSNSALATLGRDGAPEFARFELLGAPTASYRTVLFFDPDEQDKGQRVQYHAGVEAIEAYLEAMGEGRLVQSFKTHLTTPSIGRTQIAHHAIDLDTMLRLFFIRLRSHAERSFGGVFGSAVVGRPVRFAGSESEADDELARGRLEGAARGAGFEQVRFELEPIAAAYHYERELDAPELALVADFGAGTTDFCLMRLGPGHREHPDRSADIVGTGGVGVAGDDLDAALIDHLVSPALGKGTTYAEMGREHPIPRSYYDKLCRWHHLSFLNGKRTLDQLTRLHRLSRSPDGLANLIHVIEMNQGFHLYKAVERLKIELSTAAQAEFSYADGPVKIRRLVARSDFESWIADSIATITSALDDTLDRSGVQVGQVDRVFMTGGTAFVPAVRREFQVRFGAERLSGGDELMSIASGLALGRVTPR